jgi:hypothetical protein
MVNMVTKIFLGLLLLPSPAFAATLQLLTPNDVTITENGKCAVIRVAFSFPVRYVTHFPHASGDDLRIQFEPIAVSPADREALFTRRSVRPPRSEIASLAQVVYEGNVAGGAIAKNNIHPPCRYGAEIMNLCLISVTSCNVSSFYFFEFGFN